MQNQQFLETSICLSDIIFLTLPKSRKPAAPGHIYNTRNAMNSKKYFTSKRDIITWSIVESIFVIELISLLLQRPPASTLRLFICIAIMVGIYLLMAINWNYPEITDDELVIRNFLYRFFKLRYKFDEIEKVDFYYGKAGLCIKIITTKRRRPHYYCIACMSSNSIPTFLYELNSKGVHGICSFKYKS